MLEIPRAIKKGTLRYLKIRSILPLFHGKKGAIDIKSKSNNTFGKLTKSQKLGPTKILLPVKNSEIIGNVVPKKTVTVITKKRILFKTKKFSFDDKDLISSSEPIYILFL